MKHFKIKLGLLAWMICSFEVKIYSQNVETTLNLARNSFNQKLYKESLEAYNRVDFFDNKKLSELDFENLATIYLQDNKVEKAILNFNLAKNTSQNFDQKFVYDLNIIDLLTKEKKNDEAIITLFGLPETNNLNFVKFVNLYFAINYFELNLSNEAQLYFKKVIENEKWPKIDSVFISNASLKHKIRPNKIRNLNYALPGLGSAIMGDWKNTINASLLTTSLGLLTVITIYKYGLFDGAIGIIPWFQRYYLGGAAKSATIAEQKIAKKHYQSLSYLIDLSKNN
jgi:tetratricopeptide (TPR) repeat protein